MWAVFHSGKLMRHAEFKFDPTAVDIPVNFESFPPDRLGLVDGSFVDLGSLANFFVDPGGHKYPIDGGPGWQQIACNYTDDLVRDAVGQWHTVTSDAGTKMGLLDYAANVRWRKEVGGTFVNGKPVATDRESQGQITAAVSLAQVNPQVSLQWKYNDDTWGVLDAAGILALGQAVAAHVQACFAAEAALSADIKTGTVSSQAQIDGVFAAIT